MRTSTVLLGLVCLVAVAVSNAQDPNEEPMTKEERIAKAAEMRAKYATMSPEERKVHREALRAARDQKRADRMATGGASADGMDRRKTFAGRASAMNQDKNEFRGTAGMFMAIVEPVKPVKVNFPLDDATKLKFAAARDGLMQSVRAQTKNFNMQDDAVREELRSKTRSNQDNTLKILVEAVQKGSTVQEARMGIVIAQFDALDEETKKSAYARATSRAERIPEATKAKMSERLNSKNAMEKQQLSVLKTDAEKEDYVKKIYHPRQVMPTMLS